MNTKPTPPLSPLGSPTCSVSSLVPYHAEDSVTIYHGDSREILPLLGRFDLLLTDPPYGIGFAASPSKWSRDNIKRGKEGWDDTVPEIVPFVEACKKSMVWGGNHFDLPPSRGWLAWVKEKGLPSYGDCELCWTNVEMPCRHMFHRRCDTVKHAHPTQKPLALMQWCIGLAGEVQTILDPFAGSGTTGEAAKLMGKRAVLIEREERYCEIAALRLAQDVLQFSSQNK